MDIFQIEKLILFSLFFVPGFISIKIWSMLVPHAEKKTHDYLLDAISYSCINFAFFSWFIVKFLNKTALEKHVIASLIGIFIIFFVMPIIWPILIKYLLRWEKLRGVIIYPTPSSWDFFFSQGTQSFVLVHLKNGNLIGGLYGEESHASSYPYKQDIYIEEVWTVDEKGKFENKIEGSKGMIIDKDYINYIEFFKIERET